jgi:hypothetical protein
MLECRLSKRYESLGPMTRIGAEGGACRNPNRGTQTSRATTTEHAGMLSPLHSLPISFPPLAYKLRLDNLLLCKSGKHAGQVMSYLGSILNGVATLYHPLSGL